MARKFQIQTSTLQQDTIPFVSKTRQSFNLAQGIPKDYFLYAFIVNLTFRLGISSGTTNGTVMAEAPQTLVERFEISGNHKSLGDYTRLLLEGSHVYQRGNIFKGNQYTRVTNSLSGAIGNYDMQVIYYIPLALPNLREEETLFYLLDAPMWNTLNFYVDWSDANSQISGGDRTLALTANGSASGTPTMTVTRVVAKLQGDRLRLNPIPVKETFKSIDISAGANAGLVTPLNVGNFIKELMLVEGVVATGASAPKAGDAFLTLNDNVFSRIQIKRDDIIQKDTSWTELQQFDAGQLKLAFAWPTGYNMYDFNNSSPTGRSVNTSYDTRQIALQNLRFELWGNITATANEKLHVITTELAGIPVFNKPATKAG